MKKDCCSFWDQAEKDIDEDETLKNQNMLLFQDRNRRKGYK